MLIGVEVFETDILLTDAQKEVLLEATAAHRNDQNSISDQAASAIHSDIWPNNVIPLKIDSGVGKFMHNVLEISFSDFRPR